MAHPDTRVYANKVPMDNMLISSSKLNKSDLIPEKIAVNKHAIIGDLSRG
jgi:hypothetical protein